jgi:hypothetical protein
MLTVHGSQMTLALIYGCNVGINRQPLKEPEFAPIPFGA